MLLSNGVGLTTMAQPYGEIGRAAVELLLHRMETSFAPSRSVEYPVDLIVRASSAAPTEHR